MKLSLKEPLQPMVMVNLQPGPLLWSHGREVLPHFCFIQPVAFSCVMTPRAPGVFVNQA